MITNRFLRLHNGRKRFAAIVEHLRAGGKVQLVTAWKATEYGRKHAGDFKLVGPSVYVRRGKSWDCIDFTPVRFSRLVER